MSTNALEMSKVTLRMSKDEFEKIKDCLDTLESIFEDRQTLLDIKKVRKMIARNKLKAKNKFEKIDVRIETDFGL